MSPPPAINVSICGGTNNGYLSAMPENIKNSSSHRRSNSVTPSERSRITVVEDNSEIPILNDFKSSKGTHYMTRAPPKLRWIDHFLGVFCIHVTRPTQMEEFIAEKAEQASGDFETGRDSPWILPVFALSTQKYDGEHYIPKQAQCTIDTGNCQGNIVSKEFLLDVLGYPESAFLELSDSEKLGGIGATGHTLIPDGAIYLSWYHSQSTRLFRDMRFLISPHPHCDLIIGARSIQQHNLLSKPNLKTGNMGRVDPIQADLLCTKEKLNRDVGNLKLDIKKVKRDTPQDTTTIEKLEQGLCDTEKNLAVAEKEFELYKAKHDPDSAAKTITELELELQEAKRRIPGYQEPQTVPAVPHTTTSGSSTLDGGSKKRLKLLKVLSNPKAAKP